MSRALFFLYVVIAYLAFLVTILCAIGFVTGLVAPKTINRGEPPTWREMAGGLPAIKEAGVFVAPAKLPD